MSRQWKNSSKRILVADMFGHREIVPAPFDPDERVLIPISELMENLKGRYWLIDQWLALNSWTQIHGPQAKEAALDMAIAVASGTSWHGQQTAQSGVMYITWDGNAKRAYETTCKKRGLDPGSLPIQTGNIWGITAQEIQEAVNRPVNPIELIIIESRIRYYNPTIFWLNFNRICGKASVMLVSCNKRTIEWWHCEGDVDFVAEENRLTQLKNRHAALQPPILLEGDSHERDK